MSALFERASLIRLAGEPWQNAVQRAKFQIRYEDQLGGAKGRGRPKGSGKGKGKAKGKSKSKGKGKASKGKGKASKGSKASKGRKASRGARKQPVCVLHEGASGRRSCRRDDRVGPKRGDQSPECTRPKDGRCRLRGSAADRAAGRAERSCIYHADKKYRSKHARRCRAGIPSSKAERTIGENRCEIKKDALGRTYCASRSRKIGKGKGTPAQEAQKERFRAAVDKFNEDGGSEGTLAYYVSKYAKKGAKVPAASKGKGRKPASKGRRKLPGQEFVEGQDIPLSKMRKPQLKKLAEQLRISDKGTAPQIKARLEKAIRRREGTHHEEEQEGGSYPAYSSTSGTRSSDFTSVSDTTSYTMSYA